MVAILPEFLNVISPAAACSDNSTLVSSMKLLLSLRSWIIQELD